MHGRFDMSNNAMNDIKRRMASARHATQEYAHEYKDKAEHAIHELPSNGNEVTTTATSVLRTAERAPDTAYLGAMAGSMLLSLLLLGRKNKALALFVGMWPVTIVSVAMMMKNRRPSRAFEEGATPVSAGADGLLLAE
jgi:hypothetical protein